MKLEFDLGAQPPTTNQINLEKNRLRGANQKIRVVIWPLNILSVAATIWVFYHYPAVGLMHAIDRTVLAVAMAVFIIMAGGAAFAFLGAAAFGQIVATSLNMPSVAVILAVAYLTITLWMDHQIESNSSCEFTLDPIDTPENKHYCETVWAACEEDEVCLAYATALAQIGRPAVIAEVDLFEQRAANIDAQERKAETVRRQEIACMRLKTLHHVEE